MKKLITSVLALTMVLSMGALSAFAATDNLSATGDKKIDVKAMYNDKVSIPAVYSVDLEWGAMEFTYTATGTKEWDPVAKQYIVNTNAAWTESGNDITVTNHSNKAVTAAFGFSKDSTITESITGNFDVTSEQLDAGTVGEYKSADKVVSTLTVDGALDAAKTTFAKIGTVTVTIQ